MQISAPRSHYDVIIIGGGLVGASFAGLLDRLAVGRPLSILVVEAVAREAEQQPSFDARSTALSWSSRQVFQTMGLWPELEPELTPIRDIHVSDRGHFGAAAISAGEHRQEALGYVAENRLLGLHLRRMIDAAEDIAVLAPARITTVQPLAEGMALTVKTADGEHAVTGGLVVLCDGGRSPISADLGIQQEHKHYDQHALIANIAFSKPHDNVAYERFTESGPLAVLPLKAFAGQHRGALVWTVAASTSKECLDLDEAELLARLQEQFGYRLGKIARIGERFSYPLFLTVAKEQIRPGLVLLGNVAHTLHPVAGQGLNLALRDADTLAQTIQKALAENESPGAMSALQRFVDAQAMDQRKAITVTDQMIKLFSTGKASHVLARKLGLLSIDLLPGLRKGFARQAMGLPL